MRDKYVFITVDDVSRAIGLDKIEWYIKWIYELMNKLNNEYKLKTINIVVATSEGLSRRLAARHSYTHIVLIWNLDRKSFEELFYKLNPPASVEYEDVWSLLGGNPRKLIDLAEQFKWDIDRMLKNHIPIAREIVRLTASKGLLKELKLLAEDIISAEKILSEKMIMIEEILEERNIILYKDWITITNNEIPPQPEIGVGKHIAWQTPIYRDTIIKTIKNQQ